MKPPYVHKCGDHCECPYHPGLPVMYSPHHKEHACNNYGCVNFHGMVTVWREDAFTSNSVKFMKPYASTAPMEEFINKIKLMEENSDG